MAKTVANDVQAVEAYLASLPPEKRAPLERVRRAIRAAAPKAVECISYGLPAFRLGKPIAGYAAADKHFSYFPMSSKTIETLAKELTIFDTSKGTIRFTAAKPLPVSLIRKLVRVRLDEIQPHAESKARLKRSAKRGAR